MHRFGAKVMSEAGREPSRGEAQPHVEEIAARYLLQANGDPAVALRAVIRDALADLGEMERRTRHAERLISWGFVRVRPVCQRDRLINPQPERNSTMSRFTSSGLSCCTQWVASGR